jgi:hypothetical protein
VTPGTAILFAIANAIITTLAGAAAVYVNRKARHLATKEDIAAITQSVEEVKHEFEKRIVVHRLQARLEVQSYRRLWSALIELDSEHESLKAPVAGDGAYTRFAKTLYACSPFLDEAVFDYLEEILTAAWGCPRDNVTKATILPAAIKDMIRVEAARRIRARLGRMSA